MSIAILIAHKHETENDKALDIALSCIIRNTVNDYQVYIDTKTPACPYSIWNRMVRETSAEWVLFTNSDVFMGPAWDVPMLGVAAHDTIVTGVLVEPGAIGVHERNLKMDFGMRPETFRREEFEEWVLSEPEVPLNGIGWFMPSLHHRQTFIEFGGWDLSRGKFPQPVDNFYWDKWCQEGMKFNRVASFAYHLQNYSSDEEQQKAVRDEVRET